MEAVDDTYVPISGVRVSKHRDVIVCPSSKLINYKAKIILGFAVFLPLPRSTIVRGIN